MPWLGILESKLYVLPNLVKKMLIILAYLIAIAVFGHVSERKLDNIIKSFTMTYIQENYRFVTKDEPINGSQYFYSSLENHIIKETNSAMKCSLQDVTTKQKGLKMSVFHCAKQYTSLVVQERIFIKILNCFVLSSSLTTKWSNSNDAQSSKS